MSTKYIEHCIRGWGTDDECAKKALSELEAIQRAVSDAADELRLAAQHKANPGSTHGTLVQVASALDSIAKEDTHGR